MTRDEQIKKAANEYGRNNPYCYWNADELYEEDYESPSQDFKAGAEWADQTMVDKVCQYLFDNCHGEKLSLRMIEDLRKEMEEQQ